MAARDWYVAWLGSDAEPFDPVAHKRTDVVWRDLELSENEGGDATVVTLTTARMSSADLVGKRWAMLSFEHPDGTLYPVARMKRRKILRGSQDAVTSLTFDAGLTAGWNDRQAAGLAKLKVLSGFDPILVSPSRQGDPTEILDGHRRIGHFDRVTGEFTTPELLGQGLPSRTFGPGDWIGWEDGGISVSENGQQILGVQISISAAWLQILEGLFDCSGTIAGLFPELVLGTPPSNFLFKNEFDPRAVQTAIEALPGVVAGGAISTLTPDELEAGWPKPGASLGGQSGYTVVASKLSRVSNKSFAGSAQPTKAGPVHGSRERYVDYTAKAGNADDATNVALDITYFVAQLIVAYSAKQQRQETVSVFVPNGACDDPDAKVRDLNLRCEDPTVDRTTKPWLPVTHYVPGDVRRFGWYAWVCQSDHVSTASFGADVGAGLWKVGLTDGSYIGGPAGSTYFLTPRGIQTLLAGVLKATKIIALAQRRVPVEWSVPFEDVVGMSTAWHARIEAEDRDLPGGFAEGKVVSFSVKDSAGDGGWPRATIRIACCDGTGEAAPAGPTRVGYLDQPWDIVTLSSVLGYPPPADVAIGGTATVANNVAQQLAYVQARDYVRGSATRGDKTKNDPKALLKQVPTAVGYSLAAINGGPPLEHFIPVIASPWHGPRQCALPSI